MKREKVSLSVELHHSKTPLVEFINKLSIRNVKKCKNQAFLIRTGNIGDPQCNAEGSFEKKKL